VMAASASCRMAIVSPAVPAAVNPTLTSAAVAADGTLPDRSREV
jgi:hypothetical protein